MVILMRDMRKYALMILITIVSIIPFNTNHFASIIPFKNLISFIIIGLLLIEFRSWLNKQNFFLNLLVCLFFCSAYLSLFFFDGRRPDYLFWFLFNHLSLVLLFFVVEYVVYNKYVSEYIIIQIWIVAFFCLVNDLLTFLSPGKFGRSNTYLLGNKFDVSYMHIFLFALLIYAYKNKISSKVTNNVLVVMFIISAGISYYTECTTGLVGNGIFLLLYFVLPSLRKLLFNSVLANVALIAISDTLLIFFEGVYNSHLFKLIVEDILHESADLTGRTNIYANAFNAIFISPIWGVGREHNYEIAVVFARGANLQNGILDVVLSYGIVGTTIWALIVIVCQIRARKNKNEIFWIFIIMLIIASSLEITFRRYFWIYLAYASVLCIEQVNEND